MHPVSNAIREARSRQGRTLADVGESAGVTRAYVSALEQGKDNPIPRGVENVLKSLGLRVVVLPENEVVRGLIGALFLPDAFPSADHQAARSVTPPLATRPAAVTGYRLGRTQNRAVVLDQRHDADPVRGQLLDFSPHRMPEVLSAVDHHFGLGTPNSAVQRRQLIAVTTERDEGQRLIPVWAWVHTGAGRVSHL